MIKLKGLKMYVKTTKCMIIIEVDDKKSVYFKNLLSIKFINISQQTLLCFPRLN